MPLLDNPLFVTALMLVWGLVIRYNPSFKEWPNRMIVWMNMAIGIIAKLVAPADAHAGVLSDALHSVGWLAVPLQATVARQVFETFVKPTLEHFGIVGYPATPVPTVPARKRRHR